jgi:hypothetical protein
MTTDSQQPESEPEEAGFLSAVERIGGVVERGEWLVKCAAGFVLGILFCAMPFMGFGAEEPWYFWVGSGLIAFIAATLLSWLAIRCWRDL